MLRREDYIKRISHTLAVLRAHIEQMGYVHLFDSHIITEDFMARLLNIVFGYELENLNYIHKNQPGVDLGDSTNGIAFQVQTGKDKRTIQRKINVFVKEHLYTQYPNLYFFILTKKREHSSSFDTQGCFLFDSKDHILDFNDLVEKINTLPTSKMGEITEFLDREIEPITRSNVEASQCKMDSGEHHPAEPQRPISTTRVSFQVWNGQYLCAVGGGGDKVLANGSENDPYTIFELMELGDNKIALRAPNGNDYVCAVRGGGREVIASRPVRSRYETFTLVKLEGDRVALRTACGGQYVYAKNGGGGAVTADQNTYSERPEWATFKLTQHKE